MEIDRDIDSGFLRRGGYLAHMILAVLLASLTLNLFAEDCPEWRGKGRQGIWNETGILEKFPAEGLVVKWRIPIKSGYAGPSVSNNRVFVLDFEEDPESTLLEGTERLVCLDEKTGKVLWTYSWKTDYWVLMSSYALGP